MLRPTWHLVAPDDVHWLLALTGPRVQRLLAVTNRSLDLADTVVERGVGVIAEAVAGGTSLTRAELATHTPTLASPRPVSPWPTS